MAKKIWYICTMEYYSAIRRNKISSFVVMWMNLESVTQCEVSQEGKKTNVIAYMWALEKGFR